MVCVFFHFFLIWDCSKVSPCTISVLIMCFSKAAQSLNTIYFYQYHFLNVANINKGYTILSIVLRHLMKD